MTSNLKIAYYIIWYEDITKADCLIIIIVYTRANLKIEKHRNTYSEDTAADVQRQLRTGKGAAHKGEVSFYKHLRTHREFL